MSDSVWLRAWDTLAGSVRLRPLDSDDAAHFPAHRGITSKIHEGGAEWRLEKAAEKDAGQVGRLTLCARKPLIRCAGHDSRLAQLF